MPTRMGRTFTSTGMARALDGVGRSGMSGYGISGSGAGTGSTVGSGGGINSVSSNGIGVDSGV